MKFMQLVADDTKNLELLLTCSFGLLARTDCISIILEHRQRERNKAFHKDSLLITKPAY